MPGKDVIPSTVKRSPKKAQETWVETHDAAAEEYGDGERAHRTAFASLKHSFEKVGDHWEPKKKRGPSDPRAARGGAAARAEQGGTVGGGAQQRAPKDGPYGGAQERGERGPPSGGQQE